MTINSTLTYDGGFDDALVTQREDILVDYGTRSSRKIDVNEPPYAIHNGEFRAIFRTVS